ncbi:acyl carrier protein [Algoriphagus boseongensis]|uniref:Acyl carrier protein n=2 Tax=Algoriphagus boseongensis TaxID=1442587 RepID=A0A4R6T780_9BACT|nr:acyl carrier protein [Algoriphagus boseongensis]
MISVFNEFGIPITGPKKALRFYSDIQVDRFYVEGILFELETRLGVLLEDEDNSRIKSPLDVIRVFTNKITA